MKPKDDNAKLSPDQRLLMGIVATMAAMGKTIISKYIPILLAESVFVRGGEEDRV